MIDRPVDVSSWVDTLVIGKVSKVLKVTVAPGPIIPLWQKTSISISNTTTSPLIFLILSSDSQGQGLSIQIRPNVYGRCFITDVSDHYSEDQLPVGTMVKAYVKSIDGSKIDVSLRESRGAKLSIERPAAAEHTMPEIKSLDQLKEGEIVWG